MTRDVINLKRSRLQGTFTFSSPTALTNHVSLNVWLSQATLVNTSGAFIMNFTFLKESSQAVRLFNMKLNDFLRKQLTDNCCPNRSLKTGLNALGVTAAANSIGHIDYLEPQYRVTAANGTVDRVSLRLGAWRHFPRDYLRRGH